MSELLKPSFVPLWCAVEDFLAVGGRLGALESELHRIGRLLKSLKGLPNPREVAQTAESGTESPFLSLLLRDLQAKASLAADRVDMCRVDLSDSVEDCQAAEAQVLEISRLFPWLRNRSDALEEPDSQPPGVGEEV